MKGVHREGHQRSSCLLCRSVILSLIVSSLLSYCCTSWLHLSFALSLGLLTLFYSWAVFFVSRGSCGCCRPISVNLGSSLLRGSTYHPLFWMIHLTRCITFIKPAPHRWQHLSYMNFGWLSRNFFGRCHSYFSCANLAQALTGKYLFASSKGISRHYFCR